VKLVSVSPSKNEVEKKQTDGFKNSKTSRTDKQAANQGKECKKELRLEGKTATEAEERTLRTILSVGRSPRAISTVCDVQRGKTKITLKLKDLLVTV
jgi:hypothetical protein